jgi:hypothetical protein
MAGLIGKALRVEVIETDQGFQAEVPFHVIGGDVKTETLTVSRERLRDLEAMLSERRISDETALHDGRSFEVLVREESPLPATWRHFGRAFPIRVADSDVGVIYELGYASDPYLLSILDSLEELDAVQDFWRFPRRRGRVVRDDPDLFGEEDDDQSDGLIEALRRSPPRLVTMRVCTEKDRSLAQLQAYADAFLFQIGFNLDVSVVPVRSLEELARRSRIRRIRRTRIEELDPPRRTYNANLIHHYQMGVATDNAALEFLSYYHVAEAFFEDVFSDDLIDTVRDRLTRPDFSYRRKTDVRALVNLINSRLKFRQEEVTFSEKEALRLTLLRYASLLELVAGLNAIDSSLTDYYRTTETPFSGGDRVELEGEDEDAVFRSMAARVYKTRNAVVHSKEGAKPRYVPFKHDAQLLREVPLMRLVAEQIIVGSAKDLA